MTQIDFTQEFLDFAISDADAIDLSITDMQQAAQFSSQIPNPEQQWWIYLNTLALKGFEQWLQERAPELSVNCDRCTILQPQYANVLSAIANLQVGAFRVCLLTVGSTSDDLLSLPRAVVELPEFTAHFYVVVRVDEEVGQVHLASCCQYDQLQQQLQTHAVLSDADWTYSVPRTWFQTSADQLLLYLRCLDAAAIALPAIPADRIAQLANQQAQLRSLLPQLGPADQLWQQLTWEQGATVLTNPDLLNWLYQVQTAPASSSSTQTNHLSDLLQLLTQGAIDVSTWLQDELSDLAQSFAWVLLPPLQPAGALRGSTREAETLVNELQQNGVAVPLAARAAYRDLTLGTERLRLYTLIWPEANAVGLFEWSLLLVLSTPSGTDLPAGVKLRVSDRTGVLVEQQMERSGGFLYTRVVGERDEQFLATITLRDGTALALPPFKFMVY